jgi:UrcA family protein
MFNAVIKTAAYGAVTATLLGAPSVPAFATGLDDAPARVVQFGDLDLSRKTGTAVLYARIRSAAEEVCASRVATYLDAIAVAKSCRQQAIARAVADVNSPLLWSYHLERTKQSIAIVQRE